MPEGVARARARGADVGVAIVAIDAPGVQDTLVVEKLVAGPANVIHDFVLAPFLKRFTNACSQIVQDLVPGHALPFSCSALAGTAQRIKDALRIVHLVDCGRPLGAVASATARVR